MPIIDDKPYKLDIYNNRLASAIYSCSKGEDYCKRVINKLVFYDRDEILDMHAKSLCRERIPYDVSKLEPIPFLDKNEKVAKVVPLDRFWLGVFIADKKTGEIKENKIMYVSPEGEGYITDEFTPACSGYVPECVYVQFAFDSPFMVDCLDEKYYDGTHDEFLKKLYDKARERIVNVFVPIMKNENINIENKEHMTLEDISEFFTNEYRKKVKSQDFAYYRALDELFGRLGGYKVIDFDKKYNEKYNKSELGEN